MAEARPLGKAPLREAIIDLRVLSRKGIDVDSLANIGSEFADRYPRRSDQMSVTGELQLSSKEGLVARTAEHIRIGYMFHSEDKSQVVQFRTNGFTFSRLKPYTDWEQLFPEAMELWSRYVELANPDRVVRLATRYVNDMTFPLPMTLSDYLVAPPPQPPGVPGDVIGFLTQLAVRDPSSGSKVRIIQTIGELRQDTASIILDIDAFQDGLSIDPRDAAQLIERFQSLRLLKNQVFFSSITEIAAGRFE